jgi:hypothetical protein
VGAKYCVLGRRCCLHTSSFKVTPKPGLSGTVMNPLLMIGLSMPSGALHRQRGDRQGFDCSQA